MNELQSKLVNMLNWYHSFCVNNGLRYYAVGGTMLGAVRHNGFIPWDDDIDVGMPREDYDKLIALCQNVNSSIYKLETPYSSKNYYYQYCKLYDTTTTLIENTRYKSKRGIYLDVFPLDGIGNTLEESIKNYKQIAKKNNYIMTKICALSKHRKLYKNLAIIISRCFPFPKLQTVLKKTDDLCRTKRYDDYEFVANLYGNWYEKEIMKREWFGVPKLYKFEDIQIYGVQDYNSYLNALYGNYMQLPPIEKQKSHHDYLYLNLNCSYLEE